MKNKGITLIALVITIIILLILSGITIQSITNTGIFENANKAKLETKRSQIKEWLSLNLMETQTTSYDKTDSEILEIAREKAEKSEELKKLGKSVNVDGELSTEEDGEIVDAYFYVIVDKDVYKVDISGARFIGEQGKLKPKITIQNIISTTNSITVKVKTSRNEGGNVEYYIKAEDEEKYELKETKTDDTEYTFENLIQEKQYNIKVIAKAENGETAEATENKVTSKVVDATKEGAIVFSTLTWVNGKANTTISTNTNYLIQYQVNNINAQNWITGKNVDGLLHGDKVYARLWDGINGGTYGELNIIDNTAPNINLFQANVTTKEYTKIINTNIYDNESGIQIKKYAIGNRDIEYFRNNGIAFSGDTITAKTADMETAERADFDNIYYTIYAKNNAGIESINTIKVSNLLIEYEMKYGTGLCIINGAIADASGKITLTANSNACQYGPYATLPAGTYVVTINGENLYGDYKEHFAYDVFTGGGTENGRYIIEPVQCDKANTSTITYSFTLKEKTEIVEMRVWSTGNSVTPIINSVTIKSE